MNWTMLNLLLKKRVVLLTQLFIVLLIIVNPLLSYSDSWTARATSEESPPLTCRLGSLVSGFRCSGKYCDNIKLECTNNNYEISARNWEDYVSEEDRRSTEMVDGLLVRRNDNLQLCGTKGFLTGVGCKGSYCDNISIECSVIKGVERRTNGFWTTWVSEEKGGTLQFPRGYYAAGIECKGKFCDNKRFYVCRPSFKK